MIGKNILFIGAHPDDIVINAGGVIQKYKDLGCNVFTLTLSGKHHITRSQEDLRSLEELLGPTAKETHTIGDFPDTEMYLHLSSIISFIESIIKSKSIDTIFTHHADAHQDHSAVHQASLAAARSCDNIILYNPGYSGINLNSFTPNLTIALPGDYIYGKQRALERHESQAEKYGKADWIDRVVDSARHYSWKYNGTHGMAETFFLLRCRL